MATERDMPRVKTWGKRHVYEWFKRQNIQPSGGISSEDIVAFRWLDFYTYKSTQVSNYGYAASQAAMNIIEKYTPYSAQVWANDKQFFSTFFTSDTNKSMNYLQIRYSAASSTNDIYINNRLLALITAADPFVDNRIGLYGSDAIIKVYGIRSYLSTFFEDGKNGFYYEPELFLNIGNVRLTGELGGLSVDTNIIPFDGENYTIEIIGEYDHIRDYVPDATLIINGTIIN